MISLYWKVSDRNGNRILTTPRYSENDRHIGRNLRRQYPSHDGYSVRRVTVRSNGDRLRTATMSAVTVPVVRLGLFGRIRAAIRAFING